MANNTSEKHSLVFQDPIDKNCRECWICKPSNFVKANYREDQINQLKKNNIIKKYEVFGFSKDKVYASMQRKVSYSKIKFRELEVSSRTNLDEHDKERYKLLKYIYEDDCGSSTDRYELDKKINKLLKYIYEDDCNSSIIRDELDKEINKLLKYIYEDDCSRFFNTNHLIFEFELKNLHEFHLSEGTNIREEIEIVLANILLTKSSCVNVDAIVVNTNNITLCGTIKNINFEKVRENITSLSSFEQAHVHDLLVHPKFDPQEDLDEEGDHMFDDNMNDIAIGPLDNEKIYRSPEGYRRFGLSVLDRYDNDGTWLEPFGTTQNWHRGYLLKDCVHINKNIFPSNEENDEIQNIYCTTDIDVLNNFVTEFNGLNIAIQVCLDPNEVQYSEEFPSIGKVNNLKSVRPYGICIKSRNLVKNSP